MKKSFLALAVLSSLAASASAQSSVTLFGVLDASISYGSGDVSNKTALANSNNTSSRFGVIGTEELGGGLKAAFRLEGAVNNDNGSGGTTNTNNQASGGTAAGGFTFGRRSTLSLLGGFGELRVGREYTPQYWNQFLYEPFGNNGVGSSRSAGWVNGSAGVAGGVRASNSISYLSPTFSGFDVWVMLYLGENASNAAAQAGDGGGVKLSYNQGPLSVSGAYSSTITGAGTDNQTSTLGASYDLGVAKLFALVTKEAYTGIDAMNGYSLGATMPMGAGTIKASLSGNERSSAKTDQFAIGYQYDLSKRTALYGTFATVNNSGGASAALNGAVTSVNGSSNGFDLGIKHSF